MDTERAAKQRVVVVGAGVVGLSCAVQLAEAGFETNVFARELPQETSSASGHGIWLPLRVELGTSESTWAELSLREFRRLATMASPDDRAGVELVGGVVLGPACDSSNSRWLETLATAGQVSAVNQPAGGFAEGWHAQVPVVDPQSYLQYLQMRLEAADGTLTRMPVPQLPSRGITVNASGVAARALAQDASLDGMRVQVVHTTNPGIGRWVVEDKSTDGLRVSVVPHGQRVVVGGVLRHGDWGTSAEARASELIMSEACRIVPELSRADVIRDRVGVVPMRPSTRVVTQRVGQADVVHCYGHRELGFATAWGSATEVVSQVQRLVAAD